MAEGSELSWWRRTRILAISVLGLSGIATIVTLIAAPGFEAAPASHTWRLMATLGTPLLIAGLIFWAANRQSRLDAAHHLSEE